MTRGSGIQGDKYGIMMTPTVIANDEIAASARRHLKRNRKRSSDRRCRNIRKQ